LPDYISQSPHDYLYISWTGNFIIDREKGKPVILRQKKDHARKKKLRQQENFKELSGVNWHGTLWKIFVYRKISYKKFCKRFVKNSGD
jgi:hypothetical protein